MTKKNKIKLVSIVGPTATGKTKLSVSLAEKFSGEIISADSIQVYKEFNILSAKPSREELKKIPHHLIDFLSVENTYSVADFTEKAQKLILDISSRKRLPFLVGGTGLYVDSLIKNIPFENKKYKKILNLPSDGKKLMELLLEVDPKSAKSIHINNIKRLKRALEFYFEVGYPISQQIENSKCIISPYEVCKIGLNFKNRELLYSKINSRVDKMISSGLLKEVENVKNYKNVSKTAESAIGYKEIKEYFSSKVTLQEAYENVKKYSRRYAKRQITWFKRDSSINWIYIDECADFFDVVNKAQTILEKFIR